jgi:cell surface protein SprA
LKKTQRNIYSFLFILPLIMVFGYSSVIGPEEYISKGISANVNPKNISLDDDTTKLRYPFKDYTDPYSKKKQKSPLYLKNPSNITTDYEYDPVTGEYTITEKIGDIQYRAPNTMSSKEFNNFILSESISDYWMEQRQIYNKNSSANESFLERYLNPKLNVNIKGFDKIFGSNIIDIKPQGSAELIFGVNISRIENPTLPINLQRSTTFDFDMKIQMGVTGKIGDKMKVGITYNTEAQFDFENQTNLAYNGDEDEIIQSIEAGNVSLPLTGTLITGTQSLFGLKTALQFGKLKVTNIFSQQKSESSVIDIVGGAQSNTFEFSADEYEANRHFFLAHYFKDNYDRSLQGLPVINSAINITRIEVWVTNKSGNFENSRNILGLIDLAENQENIFAPSLVRQEGVGKYPYNELNNLYEMVNTSYSGVRDVNKISSELAGLSPDMVPIIHYAKIENARQLSSTDYTINPRLGYISLNSPLNDDEVLAVAYEYTIAGKVYTVGEFANSGINAPSTLILKLIKGPTLQPYIPTWQLMMKNVYSIGSYQVNNEDFKLDIYYNDDVTGTTVSYLTTDNIKGVPLLKVMGLDQLNTNLDPQPDGYFDFIDKVTINQSTGRIFFPVREPFGSHLKSKISDPTLAEKYTFQELYDSTQVKAKQATEKSKYIIKGTYKSTGGAEITLNAFNIPEGSVRVSANGATLTEGSDYLVDYNMGRVTIINQGLLESGTPIRISMENNSLFNLNRKTLLGTHLDYLVSDNFSLGGTILHLSEKPLTNKVNIGNEPISNTIWGLDGNFSTDLPLLTRIIDALPFIQTKEMSSVEITGEFAHLIPGHSKTIGKEGNAYIDDFEGSKTSIDLKAQYAWFISGTPQGQSDLFPEGNLFNNLKYGFNRAKFAWYNVNTDLLHNTSATPSHITVDDQSNHYVRQVPEKEIFPYKESITGYPTILNVFNLAYYPDQKGPYNFDVGPSDISSGINPDGTLRDPDTRWGGIMRKLTTTDFEASNIEYIEFWMMDPFIYDETSGGDLYFNLGYISEDILRDGRKSFENGLPTSSQITLVDTTAWGLVPLQQSLVNAFDNNPNSRIYQDVGLDGLSTENERSFFADYLNSISGLYGTASGAYQLAFNDPSNDDYHFFRGSDYDAKETPILERYKNFNGQEGNSPTAGQSPETYPTSATLMPDIEDINLDNTLNEEEAYFQYRVSIRPEDLREVGQNYIVDKIVSNVRLKNKTEEKVTWYQFKIPLRNPDKVVGPISDFRSIRFVRMFTKEFSDSIIMRFAQMDLVRSEWRNYEGSLPEGTESIPYPQQDDGDFDISVVSIEENGSRSPIAYVLPPGITRVTDPTNPYLRQLNEQSLAFTVRNLNDGDARAAYKNVSLDVRQYKKLQMEIHGEALNESDLKDDELSVFLRLGSDYKENYYEVEIPLKLTKHGYYVNDNEDHKLAVWPRENRFDFELELLQQVKQKRNNAMRQFGSTIQYSTAYKEIIGRMKITIVGNPNLSNIKTVMLGVRNPSRESNFNRDDGRPKSGIIWYNELRLTDFREEGGWAANARISTKLADLGNLTIAGNKSTKGFGSLDKKVDERQKEDIFQYDISSNLELGKFFPQRNRVRIPLYFGFSENIKTPQYNPLDPDILLSTTLADPELPKEAKDELKDIALDITRRRSINITNMRIEGDPDRLKDKKKRFYHISNFSLSFAYNHLYARDIKTTYNIQRNYTGSLAYVFNNRPKPIEPFKKIKFLQKKPFQIIRDFNFYTEPVMVSIRSDLYRKYQQMQTRDIAVGNSGIDPTFKKDFVWNRTYDLKYNLSKGLKLDFNAINKARIDEPYGIMDKKDPFYQQKIDSLWRNFMSLGRNLAYSHRFDISYTVPINKLPLLAWTSANVTYRTTFDWIASPITADTIRLGNKISNSGTIRLNAMLNFSRLYDKVPFLKNISDKMQKGEKNEKKFKEVKYTEAKARFRKEIAKTITHNLNTIDIQVIVRDENGKELSGELSIVNPNKVKFKLPEDYQNASIEVTGKKEAKDNILQKLMEGTIYALIGLKNISISYEENSGTILPGYLPSSSYLGMTRHNGITAPGLPFIMGIQNNGLVGYASGNKWLTTDSLQTLPYQMAFVNPISIRATAEPLKGLKIDITANRNSSKNRSEYWIPDATSSFFLNNRVYTGNYSISFLAIKTSFWKYGENYSSRAFDNFKSYRSAIAWRLANQRNDARKMLSPAYDPGNPNPDPVSGKPLNDGFPNGYGPVSQEVLIPAFLAAYGGRSPNSVSLSPFPTIPLPNWTVTYDGLSEIDLFKRIVKTITINHIYTSSFNIGSYTTNAKYNWEEKDYDGYSWTRDQVNKLFIPEQEIYSVNITESFNPLISADITWKNNLSTKIELNKTRNLTMSFSNNQLIDLGSNEIIIGAGYRFEQLPIIIKTGGKQTKYQSDLNIRGDFSFIDMRTIIRKIEEGVDQITAGQQAITIKLAADYALNERFNLKVFYDQALMAPRISTSFPTSNIKFGVSVRFTLIP